MVSVARFRLDAENIVNDIEKRCNDLEKYSLEYFVRVRTVQRIFRGYITRKHIEILHQKATCIQKHWRAFAGRAVYEELLKERFETLCWTYYMAMATRIQRIWKGYWIRSRIFNFYKLKEWLNFVHHQNEHLKHLSEKYRLEQNNLEIQRREIEAKEWIVYILYKLHHLLRTHQISGIYSLPRTKNLSDIEKMLTCLKYKDFIRFYKSYKNDVIEKKIRELPPYLFQNCKYIAHFEREFYEHKKIHKESYLEPVKPRDRFTRYENVMETLSTREKSFAKPECEDSTMRPESEEFQIEKIMCECSYCIREKCNEDSNMKFKDRIFGNDLKFMKNNELMTTNS